MELGDFDPFNPPSESSEFDKVYIVVDATDEGIERSFDYYPDRSRSAVQIPADCDRIPRGIQRIRPTDNPFDLSE